MQVLCLSYAGFMLFKTFHHPQNRAQNYKKKSTYANKSVRARLFSPKMSIFTHFYIIYAHACAKKVVILHRELISGIASA